MGRGASAVGAGVVAVMALLAAACTEPEGEAFPLATREPASNPGGDDAIVLGEDACVHALAVSREFVLQSAHVTLR